MATEEQEIRAYMLIQQIARMSLTNEGPSIDGDSALVIDALVKESREIVQLGKEH